MLLECLMCYLKLCCVNRTCSRSVDNGTWISASIIICARWKVKPQNFQQFDGIPNISGYRDNNLEAVCMVLYFLPAVVAMVTSPRHEKRRKLLDLDENNFSEQSCWMTMVFLAFMCPGNCILVSTYHWKDPFRGWFPISKQNKDNSKSPCIAVASTQKLASDCLPQNHCTKEPLCQILSGIKDMKRAVQTTSSGTPCGKHARTEGETLVLASGVIDGLMVQTAHWVTEHGTFKSWQPEKA